MSNFYDIFVHYLVYIVGFIAIGVGRILCSVQTSPLDQILSIFLVGSGIAIFIIMLITEFYIIRGQN